MITPRVLVMQTVDPDELEWIARHDGPSVVALMPDTAARFRHDPAGGPALADRMVITQLPDKKPRKLGHSSPFQQRQDLAQLEALAAAAATSKQSSALAPIVKAPEVVRPSAATAIETPVVERPAVAAPTDAVEKLSLWLLQQADLTGPP